MCSVAVARVACSTCGANQFVASACSAVRNTGCGGQPTDFLLPIIDDFFAITDCPANCTSCSSATSCSACVPPFTLQSGSSCVLQTTPPTSTAKSSSSFPYWIIAIIVLVPLLVSYCLMLCCEVRVLSLVTFLFLRVCCCSGGGAVISRKRTKHRNHD